MESSLCSLTVALGSIPQPTFQPRTLLEGGKASNAVYAGQFQAHFECLERNNQEYCLCRKPKRKLNSCMFEKFGLTKTIPRGGQQGQQVHELKSPIFKAMQK
ncbi:hypothetical protein BKA70DRAFT_1256555 [Coprinopsis sp. MPI-PUGE-AT-0042]|nr:hypothetical protein BKA70DRAFT_1256555 [Coprinopsis sp. MPI-PUGE-AT-0042]